MCSSDLIREIEHDKMPASVTDADRAVLALTDEMTRNVQVRDETYAAAKKHFSDREMVELSVTIGAYNLVSRFLVAMQVDHEAH